MLNALLTRWTGAAVAAGMMVLTGVATSAQAQFFRSRAGVPGTGNRQLVAHSPFRSGGYNRARAHSRTFGGAFAFSSGYSGFPDYGYPRSSGSGYPSYSNYGYPGYGDYGYGYYDPYSPSAQLEAEGRYLINVEQSRREREQVRQAKVQTRRRAFDEYLYERAVGPTWEDDRERLLGEEVRRSRNEPPITEIQSGRALNVLLADLRKVRGKGAEADSTALDPEVVKRLNFTTTTGSANIGLLKDAARLAWPAALTGAAYRDPRTRVTQLAREAVAEAANSGRVDPALVRELARNIDQLGDRLQNNVSQTTSSNYIEARRFLTQLEDAVKALQQPDVAGYFNGRYTFEGRTVGELIKFMSARGPRFAPAVAGDVAAYVAVHQALNTVPGNRVELIRR